MGSARAHAFFRTVVERSAEVQGCRGRSATNPTHTHLASFTSQHDAHRTLWPRIPRPRAPRLALPRGLLRRRHAGRPRLHELRLRGRGKGQARQGSPRARTCDAARHILLHSLAAGATWALAAAQLAPADKDGMMVGALVLSHWFLDLPFHRADLPLVLDWGTKYGWALWDRPMLSLAVELAVTFGTFYVYLSRTRPTKLGNGWVWALGIVMVAECYAVYFNASPPDPAARSGAVDMSLYSIPLYVLPTILAHMVDRSRVVV